MSDVEPTISRADLAKTLGLSYATAQRYFAQGILTAPARVDRRGAMRFSSEEIALARAELKVFLAGKSGGGRPLDIQLADRTK